MNITTKLSAVVTAVGLTVVGIFGLAPAANATPNHFQPYVAQQTWYAPSPATVAQPFAVPQTTKVLTCGGIKQSDHYKIDTPQLDEQYKAFIAAGVLRSKAEDQKFHPFDYSVTALPDCVPPVVKPEKPAPVIETSVVNGTPDCTTNTFPITTTTTTTDWVYNEATNTYIKGTPVVTPVVTSGTATAEQCPPPVVKPEKPAPVVTIVTKQGQPNCDTHKIEYTTVTTTTDWVYDKTTNTYSKGTPVVTTDTNYGSVGKDDCAVIVTPPTETPKPTPTPSNTPTPAPSVAPSAAPTTIAVAVQKPAAVKPATNDSQALAYTGSNGAFGVILGGSLLFIGIMLYLMRRYRSGRSI